MASGDSDTPPMSTGDRTNWQMCMYIVWTWASVIAVLLVYRWTLILLRHVRRIANLNIGTSSDSRQRYFTIPGETWAKIKRHFILAPLLKKRHNEEFRLYGAINVGTLPSRIQILMLLGYLAVNLATCIADIDWSNPEVMYQDGRNRFGMIATLNLIPLVLLAGRTNPLIWLLGISFDNMNLMHRWIGRIVVLEAITHASFFIAGEISEKGNEFGWKLVGILFRTSPFFTCGLIALSAFIAILFQTPSIIRHAFYETFLHVHQVLILTAFVGLFMHLYALSNNKLVINLLIAAIIGWVVERVTRVYLVIKHNMTNGVTKAEIEALPGDALRVTLRLARPWKFQPGQHIFLYVPSVGLWTSHPFSLAWSQEMDRATVDSPFSRNVHALPLTRYDLISSQTTSMSLVIRRRTGFTDKLFRRAEKSPGAKFNTTAFVEGPYTSRQSFQSYGTVMLFAAGVGITAQVPHVRDLVAAYASGTCATRKVVLVWIIQSPEHLEWIRPWMTQILQMEKRRDVLKILLFVTRPRSTKEIHSPSASVQMFPGKPDVGALIDKEMEKQVGAMAISCCGTGSLGDDLRLATRMRCQRAEMDFFEQAYSW